MDEYASTRTPSPGPPPGWYDDPGGAPALRWWDGRQWTGHSQPLPSALPEGTGRHRSPGTPGVMPPVPAAPAPRPAVRARTWAPWAWAVVASQALEIILMILLGAYGASASARAWTTAGLFIAVIFSIFAAWKDARALARRGEIASTWRACLALLGGVVYLVARTVRRRRRTAADWWVLATGIAVFLAAAPVIAAVAAYAAWQQAGSFGTCTTASCITADAESLKGDVAGDNSVMTKVTCQPSTVKQVVPGTYTVHCTVTYADGATWAGAASVLTGNSEVDWEPTSDVS